MARRKPRKRPSQSTRMLKTECEHCGYTARVSRRWLADLGPPLCPCRGEAMLAPEWDAEQYQGPRNQHAPADLERQAHDWAEVAELVEDAREERDAAYSAGASHGASVLTQQSVTARKPYACDRCGTHIDVGDVHVAIKLRDESGSITTVRECQTHDPSQWAASQGEGFYFSPDGMESRA